MKHRVALWQRFLRSVLVIVLSLQFGGIAPLVMFSAGCMSPEVPESPAASQAHRTTICVMPPSLPPNTKYFAADANRSVFVSDVNAEAYQRFLPQADTIFEYDLFARPSSALLLGTSLRLSCPERFDVTRPEEEVGEGESRIVGVVRIPTQTHRELSSLVEHECKIAAAEGADKRFVGQAIGSRGTVVMGRGSPQFQYRLAEILGLKQAPPPKPFEPPGVVQQLGKTHTGQEIVGVGRGNTKAVIPGGTNAVDLGRQAHWLEEGTRTERIAEACAELGVGVGQIVLGCGGMGVGGALTGTGGGAPPGALVFVGSLGLTMTGVANCGNAVRHLTIELWRSDEGDALVSTSPPSESASTESAPQTAKPAPAPQTPPVEPAKMEPYKVGKGHHVPAKKAFEGPSGYAPGYDPQMALAIPDAELKKWGVESHYKVTGAQRKKYIEFAATGQPLTWEAIALIETESLVESGMEIGVAKATVAKAIQWLKNNGVASPVRTPWGK